MLKLHLITEPQRAREQTQKIKKKSWICTKVVFKNILHHMKEVKEQTSGYKN